MILDRFNSLINNFKKNDNIKDFLNELKEEMDNPNDVNMGILDKIQKQNKVSIGTKNKMDAKQDEILINYANETIDKGDLYFIAERLENEFVVYKYEENNDSVLKIDTNKFPDNTVVNCALRLIDENYVIDEDATIELKNRITNMANELIEEQNKTLEEYRKEGHLYRVSEKINNSIFLYDITDNPSFEIEEIDFPEELQEKALEGVIFEYSEGEYKLKGE